ncbi:MAG: hypothetical protein A3I81_04955 [Deltaproteobacteria bacterium RIFCSPLOWO2_02_FULL_55_12]|nr:MAG: hypothetical protein A3I81_04955 [Deltaproteobacteria bacterium RIFCSPLOWO2_02_FULL_55_12]
MFLLAYPAYSRAEVVERPGEKVSMGQAFIDESGARVTLGSLIDRPTILSFAYFGCKDMCNTLLANLADSLGRLDAIPGQDYRVITVSFDERDTPEEAAYKKQNLLKAVGSPFPEGAWSFLTGSPEAIGALTGSTGYEFSRAGRGYNHSGALVALSPDGRIIRYFYGGSYLPADLKMAIVEGREGRVTASIRKAVTYCYSLVPEGRGFAFAFIRYAGLGTLLFAAAFIIWLSGKPGRGR